MIAEHFVRAAPLAPAADTINAAVVASRWAVAHAAHDDAQARVRAALDVVGTLPAHEARAHHELAVLNELSTVLIIGGDDSDGLERICQRMQELSMSVTDPTFKLGSLFRLSVYRSMSLQLHKAIDVGQHTAALGHRER